MIFITGATGFVGRSLTAQLERAGLAFRIHNGRINNPHDLRGQLDEVETVIHLAGIEGRGRNRLLRHVDIDGTSRLLEECERANVKRIVYLSRIGADPNDVHVLLKIKGEVEQLVRQSAVPHTIIRSATLFGRGDRFTEMIAGLILWGWPFVWLPGGGKIAMQPLWVEDAARCLIAAAGASDLIDKTITIAGEELLRYADIARLILQTMNARRIPVNIPLALMRPLNILLFQWQIWPPFTRYAVDRLFVPEIAERDAILRQFKFRPARMSESISYLRRPGLRSRFFRR